MLFESNENEICVARRWQELTTKWIRFVPSACAADIAYFNLDNNRSAT
jgi:hypothetical protein